MIIPRILSPRSAGRGMNLAISIVAACVCVVQRGSIAADTAKFQESLQATETRHTEIFNKFGPAVVGIVCDGGAPVGPAGKGLRYDGTGAVVSPDGWIVSNITTVPKDAEHIRVYFADGNIRAAVLKQTDEKSEGALIKVEATGLPFMRVSDSKNYKVGDPVYSWGNSFSSVQLAGGVSFSAGNISGMYVASSADKQSRYTGPVIETDAAVNPGSDGGPLTDSEGNLIGVLTLAYSRTRWLGLAIPSATLAESLTDFKALMKPRRSALNAGGQLQVTLFQAALEHAAEKVGNAVITLRVVRENDQEEAPDDFKKVELKPSSPIATDRASLESQRPADGFATAFLVSADGIALTAYFNLDDRVTEVNKHSARFMPLERNPVPKFNKVKKIYAYMPDGKRVEAKLLGVHKSNDLAALKLDLPEGTKLPFIEMGESCEVSTGTSVALLGRSEPPGGLTLNIGRISGQCRLRNTCSQMNALMNYGNIGGPVIGLDGKLLGIAAHLTSDTDWRQNCGVGFLLNSCEIKKVLPTLIEGKLVEGTKHAFLGVMVNEASLDAEDGAHIGNVMEGSAAEIGGMKSGDVVIEYNGKKIRNWMLLTKITRALDPGATANLKVRRGAQTLDLKIKLGEPTQ